MKENKSKKHITKKWEVSIIELEDNKRRIYKVTRRVPELNVAETKVFSSLSSARKKFKEWLS